MPEPGPTAAHRLFVAITVPAEVKARIVDAQQRLRRALSGDAVRWTSPEQFHLTLRFLGNVEVSQTDALVGALRAQCGGVGAVRLQAAGIGFFPKPRSPRIVWVGVTGDLDRLDKLWAAVQTSTNGFTREAPEARFTGHITVGRIKSIHPREAEELVAAANEMSRTTFGAWTTTQVEIIRSQLSPQGARYDTLAALPL